MTPPVLVFLATFVACAFIGAHSVWRFVVRSQLPSLVHAGSAAWTTFAAWLIFQGSIVDDPMNLVPKTPAIALLAWAWASVGAIHLYELGLRKKKPRGVPYDGLFPWWRE